MDTSREDRDAWDGIATGYDKYVTPTHMWLANEGLRRAGLQSGMRFLDVAAGSGALSIPAARLGAHVLSTDMSPVMLGKLAARAREEKLDLETCVMDGHALELEDDVFDMWLYYISTDTKSVYFRTGLKLVAGSIIMLNAKPLWEDYKNAQQLIANFQKEMQSKDLPLIIEGESETV